MKTPLTFWNRAVYGAIAALFGCLLGLAAAALLALGFESSPPVRSIVVVSAVYFFVIGVVRGPDAGFFVGEALTGVAGLAGAEMGVFTGEPANSDKPGAWHSPVLLTLWIGIVVFLAWRG